MFRVQRIYDELMFDLLSATCTIKMCLACRLSLVFPRMFWPFISPFSLHFPFLRFLSLCSWRSRVFLFFKLSFSVLRSLVSSSYSSLFFCSSMVDYSFVRVDCPSISFLFAHLGCLLEIVERECLKGVSLFVGKDCPYRFVLSSLFLLASCSARVARCLKMSREVMSSGLEMGLSLSNNREILEVTSLSTPYKAWDIQCALSEKDKKRIRDRFQFPNLVRIRITSDEDRAYHSYADKVCFYEADFASGLRLLVHPFVRELFTYLHLAPAQLVRNSWWTIICCMVVWMFAIDRDVIKRDEFLHFYRLRKSKDLSYWEYKPWDRASKLIINSPLSLYNWKPNFFFISGNGWEFVPGEGLDEASKFFRS